MLREITGDWKYARIGIPLLLPFPGQRYRATSCTEMVLSGDRWQWSNEMKPKVPGKQIASTRLTEIIGMDLFELQRKHALVTGFPSSSGTSHLMLKQLLLWRRSLTTISGYLNCLGRESLIMVIVSNLKYFEVLVNSSILPAWRQDRVTIKTTVKPKEQLRLLNAAWRKSQTTW